MWCQMDTFPGQRNISLALAVGREKNRSSKVNPSRHEQKKIMRQIKDHLYRSAPKIGSKNVSLSAKAFLTYEQRIFWTLIVYVDLESNDEVRELEMTSVVQREESGETSERSFC